MTILIYLGIVVVLCFLQYPFLAWSLRQLRCKRSLSCTTAFAGESGEMIEVVVNHSPFIIPWLRLESYLSPYLKLGKQDSVQSLHETFYASLFTLMPYQQIRRTHHIRFLRRGVYELGSASLTSGDILNVFRFGLSLEDSVQVLVFPRLLDADQIPPVLSQQMGELSRRRQLMEDPFLVRGIRAYQPGDPVRDIHWAATARTGEVQVRLHDYSARTKLLVVLNAQHHRDQWHAHLDDKMAEEIEYGISLAATVCIKALEEGVPVGFASNMPVDSATESTVILPGEGSGWDETLLTTFARLKILRTESFPGFLQSLTACSGISILVLSAYDSDEIQTALGELRKNGNEVMFHRMEGGGLWDGV